MFNIKKPSIDLYEIIPKMLHKQTIDYGIKFQGKNSFVRAILKDVNIKCVCLDCYGTVIASDDHDCSFPPRKGIESFFDMCDEKKIKIVSTSDSYIPNVKNDLKSTFSRFPDRRMHLERYSDFIQLKTYPKDFRIVAEIHGFRPNNILVIGDQPKDFDGAKIIGCYLLKVPEYTIDGDREFDFSKVVI